MLHELQSLADPERARNLARFFKTGPGAYGHGDRFYGITVPQLRALAKRFPNLEERDIEQLFSSPFHEARFLALVIRVRQYRNGDARERVRIANWYLRNASRINNWDLVDTSAPYILGDYFLTRSTKPLFVLAHSRNLWRRRIAIITTLWFIKMGRLDETLRIAKLLLADQHDLIHKAVGWALREVGKRSKSTLEHFLQQHIARMSRTTLRYAIERFSRGEREKYLRA